MVTHPPAKEESVKIRNSQSCNQNYAWRNFKQTSKLAPVKKVVHGPNSSAGEFLIKKKICLYMKDFGIDNVHNVWICKLTKISDQ